MGDRAMAEIKVIDGSLYFYTHWAGYELYKCAEKALEKAQTRIGDDSYAMKIVVDELIKTTDTRDCETGGGLLLRPNAEDSYNNDKPSVLIDLVDNKIYDLGNRSGIEQ